MKTLILLLMTTISWRAFSQTLDNCISLGQIYADGRGIVNIPDGCKQQVLDKSNLNAYKEFEEKDIVVYGYKNFIFMYLGQNSGLEALAGTLPQELMLTGKQTRLTEVLSLDVDFNNNTVVALAIDEASGKKAIFTYRLWAGGNLAPIRKIYSDDIQDATNVRIDPSSQKIYVLFKTQAKVKTFKILADIDGRRENQEVTVQSELGGPSTLLSSVQDIAFKPDGSGFYILDSESKKIYHYNDLNLGDLAPMQEKLISGGNGNYQIIKYNNASGKLKVIDSIGTEIILSI